VAAARQAGKLLLLPLPLLLLLAPHALAHDGFDAGAPLGEGSVHVRILGAPLVVANAPLRLEVVSDAPLPFEARLVEPDGRAGAWFPLRDEGARAVADVTFARAGEWRLELRAPVGAVAMDVPVWPAGRAFVEPGPGAATRGVVLVGSAEPLLLDLLDAQHRPLPLPEDAVALVRGPEGEERVPLAARGERLALERAWTEPGVHVVEVVAPSLGLERGERPAMSVLVVPEEDAEVYGLAQNETPLGPLALAALALAAVAASLLTRARP